mgnify:FL=1
MNWNKAMELASGEYIKILHHDDWFNESNSLGDFVTAIDSNPKSDLAFCFTEIFNVTEKSSKIHKPESSFLDALKQNALLLFNNNQIGSPSAIIFRKKKY